LPLPITDEAHHVDHSPATGGSSDVLGRAFAAVAKKHLEQPIVAMNKTGASGMVGGQAGAQAAPTATP